MTRYHVVPVAVVLLLAGCSGALPGVDDAETEREPFSVDDPVEPTSEADETDGEAEPDYLAPGVTADGVENVPMLMGHHHEVLERESENGTYVVVLRSNRTTNGTILEDTRKEYVVDYPGRWHVTGSSNRTTRDGFEASAGETWVTRSEVLIRSNGSEGPVQYRNVDPPDRFDHPPAVEKELGNALLRMTGSGSNVTVAAETRNGTSWYVVTARAGDDASAERTTVHVREDGFVGYLSSESTIGREVVATEGLWLEFRIAPNETLERPDWYADALEATDGGD